MSQNEMLFNVMNTTEATLNGTVLIDYLAIGLTDEQAASLTVTDMLGNNTAKIALDSGKIRITLTLESNDIAALLLK